MVHPFLEVGPAFHSTLIYILWVVQLSPNTWWGTSHDPPDCCPCGSLAVSADMCRTSSSENSASIQCAGPRFYCSLLRGGHLRPPLYCRSNWLPAGPTAMTDFLDGTLSCSITRGWGRMGTFKQVLVGCVWTGLYWTGLLEWCDSKRSFVLLLVSDCHFAGATFCSHARVDKWYILGARKESQGHSQFSRFVLLHLWKKVERSTHVKTACNTGKRTRPHQEKA